MWLITFLIALMLFVAAAGAITIFGFVIYFILQTKEEMEDK